MIRVTPERAQAKLAGAISGPVAGANGVVSGLGAGMTDAVSGLDGSVDGAERRPPVPNPTS